MTLPQMDRKQTTYLIHIREHFSPHWSDWLEGFTVQWLDNGETILTGSVADQSALHGLLAKIRDLNLTLIAVHQIDPPKSQKQA